MTQAVDDILLYIEREFPRWLADRDENLDAWTMEDLENWLVDKKDAVLSVGRKQGYLSQTALKRFIFESRGKVPDMALISTATRLALPRFLCAIGLQKRNTNSGILFEEFAHALMLVTTLGWRDHAELHARLGLQEMMKHSIQRGTIYGGALRQVTTSHGFAYMIMDVFKDFLGAEKTSTQTPWRVEHYEDYAGGYGGWAEIAANWRVPDPNAFAEILNRAADYHVAQSRGMSTKGSKYESTLKETHFEVEGNEFWLLPVILFTFLRLREWEGLTNPRYLSHDLFRKGVFRELPPAPRAAPYWPPNPFFDQIDAKFRAENPETPSLADLPRLRAAQS